VSAAWLSGAVRTKLQVSADRAAETALRNAGEDLQHLREDAGLTKSAVARAAGIDPTYLAYIERGERDPRVAVLSRLAAALGATVGLRVFPSTGPPIRDRFQARMIEAFLRMLPAEWDRHMEVAVHRPVRGVIDAVIARVLSGRVVSIEAHSEIRRLEQQLRWAAVKSEALPSSAVWQALGTGDRPLALSRILLLRSTATTRTLVRSHAATFAAAYPANSADLLDALLDPTRPWPGNGILWARVEGASASIVRGIPRGARPSIQLPD
jgi:transcriptional regulator with XRE-family HTH domain